MRKLIQLPDAVSCRKLSVIASLDGCWQRRSALRRARRKWRRRFRTDALELEADWVVGLRSRNAAISNSWLGSR
ncbi:MAG: hypothetical protein RL701_2471 [Pseudomonadota bacterium]